MANRPLPSPEVLRQLMEYEPETGKLFWKVRDVDWFNDTEKVTRQAACARWNARYSGKEAGRVEGNGYLIIGILGWNYRCHRVIWAMVTNEWPQDVIDHIDGDQKNNRFENLRSVSVLENARNLGVSRNNKSGVPGVRYCRRYKKWVASISVDKRKIELGAYRRFEDAVVARLNAQTAAGFHPNHGKRPSCFVRGERR